MGVVGSLIPGITCHIRLGADGPSGSDSPGKILVVLISNLWPLAIFHCVDAGKIHRLAHWLVPRIDAVSIVEELWLDFSQ